MNKEITEQKIAQKQLEKLNNYLASRDLPFKEVRKIKDEIRYWANKVDQKTNIYFEYKYQIDAKDLSAAKVKFVDEAWYEFYKKINAETLTDIKTFEIEAVFYEEEDKTDGYVKSIGIVSNGMIAIYEITEMRDKSNLFFGRLTIIH